LKTDLLDIDLTQQINRWTNMGFTTQWELIYMVSFRFFEWFWKVLKILIFFKYFLSGQSWWLVSVTISLFCAWTIADSRCSSHLTWWNLWRIHNCCLGFK
jgi:hypothetical protein